MLEVMRSNRVFEQPICSQNSFVNNFLYIMFSDQIKSNVLQNIKVIHTLIVSMIVITFLLKINLQIIVAD